MSQVSWFSRVKVDESWLSKFAFMYYIGLYMHLNLDR